MRHITLAIAILLICCSRTTGQRQLSADSIILQRGFVKEVTDKVEKVTLKLDKLSAGAVDKMYGQERRIIQQMLKNDSSALSQALLNLDEEYKIFATSVARVGNSPYLGGLDTITSMIKVLQLNPELLESFTGKHLMLDKAGNELSALKEKIGEAENVKNFLNKRSGELIDKMKIAGLTGKIGAVQKTAYYYKQQVDQWKDIAANRGKAEARAIKFISETKVFKQFMTRHSQLAQLFPMPESDDTSRSNNSGLQSRADIDAVLDQKMKGGSQAAFQQMKANIRQAQFQMAQLKDLVPAGKKNEGPEPSLSFRPNPQKSRSFLKRLQYGINIQSQRSNGLLPRSTDLGVSVGYKLTDRLVAGVGLSYRFSLGKDFRHFQLTHMGAGARSFLEMNIKRSFGIAAGFELSHQDAFRRFVQLRDVDAWQKSGLAGLTKVISLKSKFFKQTRLQLMWDFLSYSQVPQTQPLVFRYNYSF